MRRVILESPYSGDVERNERYARACMLDCLRRGDAPMVSHLLYTQVLDDTEAAERALGMRAGFAWASGAEAVVVYTDFGISRGMGEGMVNAVRLGLPLEFRTLEDGW